MFARAYALAGAIPVIAEKNGHAADAVADEIGREGFAALAVEADVSDPDS